MTLWRKLRSERGSALVEVSLLIFVFGMPLQILVALVAVGLALVALPGDVTNLVGRAMTQIFGA